LCLKEGNPPVFQIYWRFVDWRYCPTHNCLMESICWDCGQPTHYPRDMEASPAGRNGHGSQSRCQRCACDLSAAIPCLLDPRRIAGLSRTESHWLYAGRSIVAALAAPLPATLEDASPSLRRALEIDCLPTAHQGQAFERAVRAMHDPSNPPRRKQSRYYSMARRNWGGKIFPFARCLDSNAGSKEELAQSSKAPGRGGRPPRPRALASIAPSCCDRCGALSRVHVETGLSNFLHIGFDASRRWANGHGTLFDIALCHDCLTETLGPWLRLSISDWRGTDTGMPPALKTSDAEPDG
jgi:hypothetical protein